jgi:hypothetical protein
MDAENLAMASCVAAGPLTPTLSPGYGGEGARHSLSREREGARHSLSREREGAGHSLSRVRERVGVRVVGGQELRVAR